MVDLVLAKDSVLLEARVVLPEHMSLSLETITGHFVSHDDLSFRSREMQIRLSNAHDKACRRFLAFVKSEIIMSRCLWRRSHF